DGMSAAQNDPVRGRGTFEAVTCGIARLAEVGLSPAITVVEHEVGMAAEAARVRFLAFARGLGLAQPRLKFLPLLRIGREAQRTHGYTNDEIDLIAAGALDPAVREQLVCASSRLVTAEGVMTCPILLDAPGAQLGRTLAETLHPIRLR